MLLIESGSSADFHLVQISRITCGTGPASETRRFNVQYILSLSVTTSLDGHTLGQNRRLAAPVCHSQFPYSESDTGQIQ